MKLNLKINGLTHHALAKDETRERFVQEAVGREVLLRQMEYDEAPMVGVMAYMKKLGFAHIGNVERMSLALALRALRGEDKVELKGKIVKAEPYMLTAEVEVTRLAEELPEAHSLRAWQYTGPMMDVSQDEQLVNCMVDFINGKLEDADDVETLEDLIQDYYRLTATDISRECLRERSAFAERLEAMAAERLQALGARLREASQRLGGDHGMARVGGWMKHDVAESEEARRMVLRTRCSMSRAGVLVEAEQLPKGLWNLWRTDEKAFARALYNMSPSREDVRRVLSCLVWLDATADGAASDDGARGVALMVDTALELDDEEVTRNMELVLARANDKAAGAYGMELRRLRRWQEEERVRALPLPQPLDTPEGHELLLRAQHEGWLDEALQPTSKLGSKSKASMLAAVIGGMLKLSPLWEPFEQLWHATNLRILYNAAQLTRYYPSLAKKVTAVMR